MKTYLAIILLLLYCSLDIHCQDQSVGVHFSCNSSRIMARSFEKPIDARLIYKGPFNSIEIELNRRLIKEKFFVQYSFQYRNVFVKIYDSDYYKTQSGSTQGGYTHFSVWESLNLSGSFEHLSLGAKVGFQLNKSEKKHKTYLSFGLNIAKTINRSGSVDLYTKRIESRYFNNSENIQENNERLETSRASEFLNVATDRIAPALEIGFIRSYYVSENFGWDLTLDIGGYGYNGFKRMQYFRGRNAVRLGIGFNF